MSEILLSNRKCALLGRDTVAEDRTTIGILKERNQCIEIQTEDLLHMEQVLERMEQFPYSFEYEYHNDDYEIGKKLLLLYPERRKRGWKKQEDK